MKFRKRYRYYFITEAPDIIKQRVIYIVGFSNRPWLLLFKCPCGCNDDIYLNLLCDTSPQWQYVIEDCKISIYPSINRLNVCQSHFFIRNSKLIDWDYEKSYRFFRWLV